MKKILKLSMSLAFLAIVATNAQVKISDTGSTSPDANSILELESATKGFLPPRVVINDLSSVAPLTGTVPAGMLVYSSGGTVADGYYYWNGSNWVGITGGNIVAKTTSTTLTKTETFVVASGDRTLNLPAVTAADDGLAITIKNIGTHTDLIQVVGNTAGVKIDGNDTAYLYRWKARTFVAYGGNWLRKEKDISTDNVFDVSPSGSWTTIVEVIEFLNAHMVQESIVKLDGGTYEIDATQIINLPFHLTIQGASYGEVFIIPVSGIGNNPLFRCQSPCSFKMIDFDGSELSGYGNTSGQDAIHLETDGAWFEIKDCTFEHFNKTINVLAAVDLWFFESDVSDAVVSGVELAAGAADAITFKTSETDFTNCAKGINMLQGNGSTLSIQNCSFFCSSGQTGIVYVPATFINTASMFITNTAWNNATGSTYMSGFDFSRSDGRDANIDISNNSGLEDKNPKCKINVVDNTSTTLLVTRGSWYKIIWPFAGFNDSYYTCNWAIDTTNNATTGSRMTFLPSNTADCFIIISGNVVVDKTGSVNVGIVKNGVTTKRYGETTLRVPNTGVAYQFATTIYLQNIRRTDYFEIFASISTGSGSNSTLVGFQDINIFVNAQ